jgi:hypothetical protein
VTFTIGLCPQDADAQVVNVTPVSAKHEWRHHAGRGTAVAKTHSEELFETYLSQRGIAFEFEPEILGVPERPDYLIHWNGASVLLDAKEFQATGEDFALRPGAFLPFTRIREKIEAGRTKFKNLKDRCCALVVHNSLKPLVVLDNYHVQGAMLGDPAFSVPIDLPARPAPPGAATTLVFTGGGSMNQGKNTTLSAVVVLGHYNLGERRFHRHRLERETRTGRTWTMEEMFAEAEGAHGTERDLSLRELRVVVHENPHARIVFPSDLFTGPFDERHGVREGRFQRLFAGDGLLE